MSNDGGVVGLDWQEFEPWIGYVSPVERTLWAVILLAAVCDTVLTVIGLELCFTEANPVAAAVIEWFGVFGLVVLKGGAVLLLLAIVRRLSHRYTIAALFGFSLPQIAATGLNTMLLLQHAASCTVG